MTSPEPLVEVTHLSKWYRVRSGWSRIPLHVLRNISLTIRTGETFAIVGESGAGKSTFARCILTLEQPSSGTIRIERNEINWHDRGTLHSIRRRLGWIHQHYRTAFNPKKTVAWSLHEAVRFHPHADELASHENLIHWLHRVSLPEDVLNRYPHELSGGQLQRCAIVRAFIHHPVLVVCDEPTSALDLPIQKSILGLLQQLQKQTSVTLLYITHDLSTVRSLAHSIGVLYRGYLVEKGTTAHVLDHPLHPYTQTLIASIPVSHPRDRKDQPGAFKQTPVFSTQTKGCIYAPVCQLAEDQCRTHQPNLRKVHPDHEVACFLVDTS